MVALALALGVLLPVLAVLQYRWLGRLSDDEAARMRATLEGAVARFSEDVERELTRAASTFTLTPAASPDVAAAQLARSWRTWTETAPFPGLVRTVYWVAPGPDASRLYRLRPETGTLEAVMWPEDLAGWRGYFERVVMRDSTQGPLERVPASPPLLSPALVMPVPRTAEEASPGRQVVWLGERAGGVVVALNETVLARQVFPRLTRAYVSGSEKLTYDVAVVWRAAPAEVLFASNPGLPRGAFAHSDAAAVFGRLGWSPFRDPLEPQALREEVHLAPGHEGAIAQSFRVQVVEEEAPGFQRDSLADGAYRLLVRHRAGSLEAAVSAARRRNLGLSLGIIAVLGGAVALFYVAGQRARQLAAQQVAFVAGVSHELRTPLTVIRMAGENLADGTVTDPEQARAYGRIVRDEGMRLTDLVDGVLALAAAGADFPDRVALTPTAVDDVVERALTGCRPFLDSEGADVRTVIAPELPPVRADADALGGALRNLVVNAVKYSGDACAVSIEATASADGRQVHIAVRDAGIGIPPDEQARIFEPFYRGREARDAQIHGSGLGLSLVRRVAELHGGTVCVESAPGQGSTFTLSLPAATGPRP